MIAATSLPKTGMSVRERAATLELDKASMAAVVDQSAPSPIALNGVSLKRTPSASTSKTVSRLLAQHTGGSHSSYSESLPTGSSRPSSPLEGIRVPSAMSVLKPSDFARRKAAFMQEQATTGQKFHAELERRYGEVPSMLTVKELPKRTEAAPRGTFVIPKLRSTSTTTPPNPSLLTPPGSRLTSATLNASPEASPTESTASTPKIEIQVLELNKKLIDSTVENKNLAAEISTKEKTVMDLQTKHQDKPTEPECVAPPPAERQVPKAEFDALIKDTEKATKELEAIEKKAQEREKEIKALAAKAAKLQSKEKAEEAQKDPRDIAAKETLEQAVERLREQVEVATRQSSEVVSRRMSSSSRASERYGPSTTRVPLSRNRRANGPPSEASNPPTPNAEKMTFDDTRSVVTSRTNAASNPNRRSQVVSIAPSEPIPEREDLQRSIRSYYTDVFRPTSPLSPTPLPTINHSDYDGPSTDGIAKDMAAMMDSFSSIGFTVETLSLTAPPTLAVRPRQRVSTSTSPVRPPLSPPPVRALDTHSLRSKPSNSSIRGKKKGWMSMFKVKLGSSDDDRSKNDSKPPVLAPISQSTPISFAP